LCATGIITTPNTTAPQTHPRQRRQSPRSDSRVERKYPTKIIHEKYAAAGQFTCIFDRTDPITHIAKSGKPIQSSNTTARS
jgi:hypothetical protein